MSGARRSVGARARGQQRPGQDGEREERGGRVEAGGAQRHGVEAVQEGAPVGDGPGDGSGDGNTDGPACLAFSSRLSWTTAAARTRATSTIGTLTRKIARQPIPSTRAPPSSGPAGRARLPMPAHTPMARARSAGSGKARPMTASVPGSSSAAPAPCATRAAISAVTVGASPQASDPAPKTASPASTTRR